MKNIRFLSILLTLCMLLAMVACSNDETPETPSTETPTTEAPTTEAPDDDDDPDDTTSGTTENGGSDTPTLKYTWATQGGDGTAADPLIINQNNFVDFYNYYLKGGFEAFVDADEHFKLGSDIVVNEGNAKDWATTNPTTVFNAPMNSLVGTFDGAGHTISGLCIKTQNKYCAIFDSIGENATLKNLRVVNSYFNARGSDNGYWNTGTFAGRMDKNSTIENCYSNAFLDSTGIGFSGEAFFGGIVGRIHREGCKITSCVFAGEINAISARAGGIVGGISTGTFAWVEIKNCLNLGKVTGYSAGGIIGYDQTFGSSISKVINTVNLSKDIIRRQNDKPGNDIIGTNSFYQGTIPIDTYVITDVRPGPTAENGGIVFIGDSATNPGLVDPEDNNTAYTLRKMTLSQFLALGGTADAPAGWNFKEGCVPCPIAGLEISIAPYLTAWGITLN